MSQTKPTSITTQPDTINFKVNQQTGEAFISMKKTAELINIPRTTLRDFVAFRHSRNLDTKQGLRLSDCYQALIYLTSSNNKGVRDKVKGKLSYLNSINSKDIRDLCNFKPDKPIPKGKSGWVYLLRCEDYYKIGVSRTSVEERVLSLITGNPFEIIIIHSKKVKNCYQAEKFLHSKYRSFHYKGEWFKDIDVEELIGVIDGIK